MGKPTQNAKQEEQSNQTNENTGTGTSNRGRAVVIKHPDTGQEVRRVDFIRERYEQLEKEGFEGSIRGKIAKELSEIQGEKVPYQVVFAATKPQKSGEEGGKSAKKDEGGDPSGSAA